MTETPLIARLHRADYTLASGNIAVCPLCGGQAAYECHRYCHGPALREAAATITRLEQERDGAQLHAESVEAELRTALQAIGLASTCVSDMEIDASNLLGMMQRVCDRLATTTREITAVLDGAPSIRVREGGGDEDILKSLAVTVSQLRAQLTEAQKQRDEANTFSGTVKWQNDRLVVKVTEVEQARTQLQQELEQAWKDQRRAEDAALAKFYELHGLSARLAQIEALRPRADQLSSHLSWCKDIGVLTPTEDVVMRFLSDLLALFDAPQPQTEPR